MKYILYFLLVFTALNTNAQVEDIRKKSEEKKEQEDTDSNDSEYRSSNEINSSPADGCASMACGACFDMIASFFGAILLEHHDNLKANRDINPLPFSFQVRPIVGFNPDNNVVNMLPEVSGNLGVYSTNFRVNYLMDFEDLSVVSYGAYEWQILVLNLIPLQELGFHIGAGIYFDRHSKQSFPEFSTAIDLNLLENKSLNRLSGRITYDASDVISYYEVEARSAYKFIDFEHLYAHLDVGLSVKNYNQTANMFFVHAGLLFTIH